MSQKAQGENLAKPVFTALASAGTRSPEATESSGRRQTPGRPGPVETTSDTSTAISVPVDIQSRDGTQDDPP